MELGLARLVGTDGERLFDAATALLDDPAAYRRMSRAESPYGDGRAAGRIAARLLAEAAPA
jgi:UDP-N-acetylglucosamine 2-epimerase (non-hydrolysing)